MVDVELVAHPNTIRGPIEETYNALREGIEAAYVAAVAAAEATRRADLLANAARKSAAFTAAGLNSDGSTPSNYPETADPENTVPPSITGTAMIGEELTAHSGIWTFGPSFTYQWQRADSDETANVDISGETSATYTPGEDDLGKIIRVKVTATNSVGHHHAYTDYTTEVLAAVPVNTVLPTITGTPELGEVLTGDDGTWTGEDTIVRQWERADADGRNAEDIAGEQDTTYTLVQADVGKKVRLIVSATNEGGTTTVTSDYTSVVGPEAPENTVAPSISGTAQVGEVLTGDDGTWTGEDTSVRQWERADADGSNAADIVGEQDATYTVVEADLGKKIRLIVSATNAGGTTTVESAWTAVVVPVAPENTIAPTISGTETDGSLLTADEGTWSGDPTFTYQWERADSDESNNADIAGATDSTYMLVQADVGKKVRVEVTGTNDGGSDVAESAYTGVIAEPV